MLERRFILCVGEMRWRVYQNVDCGGVISWATSKPHGTAKLSRILSSLSTDSAALQPL
jgi:hypothetical protein